MVVQNTGKRVVLQVHGSVEVCRITIFEVPISNAPVRVGSGYRLGYYFIYFPVMVQTQGSVLSSKWTVLWKSAGSPFPGTSMGQ